jgi:hypothetical protein
VGFESVEVRRVGFAPAPKHFPFLTERMNAAYRRRVWTGIQRWSSHLPHQLKQISCAHLDVSAVKPEDGEKVMTGASENPDS